MERVWANWQNAREQLGEIYSELPTSVFQADSNDTNVLLDEEGNFKEVYDFNIGGKEVFMNLIFRETPYVSTRGWDSFYRKDNTEIVHSESYTENGMAFGVNRSIAHAENNIEWFRSKVVWVVE